MVRKKQVNNQNGAVLNRDFPRRGRSLITPYNPDSLWTMKERNRIIASNKNSKTKGA